MAEQVEAGPVAGPRHMAAVMADMTKAAQTVPRIPGAAAEVQIIAATKASTQAVTVALA